MSSAQRVNPLASLQRDAAALRGALDRADRYPRAFDTAAMAPAASLRAEAMRVFGGRPHLDRGRFVRTAKLVLGDDKQPAPVLEEHPVFVQSFMGLWQANLRYKHLFRQLRVHLVAFIKLMPASHRRHAEAFAWAATRVFWQLLLDHIGTKLGVCDRKYIDNQEPSDVDRAFDRVFMPMQERFDNLMKLVTRVTTMALVLHNMTSVGELERFFPQIREALDGFEHDIEAGSSSEVSKAETEPVRRLCEFVCGTEALNRKCNGKTFSEYVANVLLLDELLAAAKTGSEQDRKNRSSLRWVVYSMLVFLYGSDARDRAAEWTRRHSPHA